MRETIGVIGALLALAVPAAAQQAEVTLEEAVRLALQVQPAMVQARGDARNADASKRSALGAFLPSISTNAAAIRNSTPRRDPATDVVYPPGYTYSVGLSASLPLFDGLQRFSELRAASAGQQASEAGLVNQRFQVRLQTKQLFYAALSQEDLVRVADAQVRRAEQQHQISVEKLRAGSATRSDSLRSRVELGNARIAQLEARAGLATSQANLGRQIGVDRAVRAAPDTALPTLPDTSGLRAAVIASAPVVVEAESQSRAARASLVAARSQYLPTLTLSYSNSQNGLEAPWQGLGNYNETFNWRFGLSWTLFNGFTRERNQVSAAVSRDVAVARAADARREVNAQLTQQLATLTTAYQQIELSRANVAAATEDLRVQQERYRVGAATILDLLISQASLTQAEVSLVQSRFDYVIALAQVEALVGREL